MFFLLSFVIFSFTNLENRGTSGTENAKMIPVEAVSRNRAAEEGVNSNRIYLIHCKNFCKYSNVPPPRTIIIKKIVS
jgi:hypothetical protein